MTTMQSASVAMGGGDGIGCTLAPGMSVAIVVHGAVLPAFTLTTVPLRGEALFAANVRYPLAFNVLVKVDATPSRPDAFRTITVTCAGGIGTGFVVGAVAGFATVVVVELGSAAAVVDGVAPPSPTGPLFPSSIALSRTTPRMMATAINAAPRAAEKLAARPRCALRCERDPGSG